MDRVGGYTLIEVMIFLAVSGVLFISAVALIQGQQGRTEFSQSIRDIDSKIQQYVSEVSASYFPSTEKYSCSVDATGRPLLKNLPSSLGSNQDCIFLGKALQFHDNPGNADDTITVYSILGRRIGDAGTLVSSFSEANPTPTTSLVETYTLPFGTKVTSACKDSTSPCNVSAMAGFYIDLSQTSTDVDANKSASLVSYQYPGSGPGSYVNLGTPIYPYSPTGATYSCLTLDTTFCKGLDASSLPAPFTSWILCFQGGASNQTATITVNSGSAGIQTKVDFVGCS